MPDMLELDHRTAWADVRQAIQAQQAILAWSIAGIGALAAGLLAVSAKSDLFRLVGFGIWLPLLVIGASFAWIGELVRMERGAQYLRALERTTWKKKERDFDWALLGTAEFPLAYQNALRSPRGGHTLVVGYVSGGLTRSAMAVGYVGGGLIYGGSLFSSEAIFALLANQRGGPWWTASLVLSPTVVAIWVAFAVLTTWRLYKATRTRAGF